VLDPAPAHSPKQVTLEIVGEACGADVGIQISLKIVVAGHLMALAAFLVQPNPAAAALGVVVLHPHLDRQFSQSVPS
jgi:hypothetical protein